MLLKRCWEPGSFLSSLPTHCEGSSFLQHTPRLATPHHGPTATGQMIVGWASETVSQHRPFPFERWLLEVCCYSDACLCSVRFVTQNPATSDDEQSGEKLHKTKFLSKQGNVGSVRCLHWSWVLSSIPRTHLVEIRELGLQGHPATPGCNSP